MPVLRIPSEREEMPIPESERVIYRNNPLAQVICQLRFPQVLRIASQAPAEFQDRIRQAYPHYEKKTPLAPPNAPPELARIVQSLAPDAASVVHEFVSADRNWSVALSSGFVALDTRAYLRWEDFRERIASVTAALRELYEPAFYTRIGLRYIDLINRSELGLADACWSDLLAPHIAAELGAIEISPEIEHVVRELKIRLPEEEEFLQVKHGFRNPDVAVREQSFLIDADFFAEGQREIDDATGILDRFNRSAGNWFRWCISPRLDEALGHVPPD